MSELNISIKMAELTGTGGDFSVGNPAFFKVLSDKLRASSATRRAAVSAAPENIRVLKRSMDFRKGREPTLDLRIALGKDTVRPAVGAGSTPSVSISNSSERPVVVGFGPAGIFCALTLARAGMRPVVIERGKDIDSRTKDVQKFWNGEDIDPDSNVQFGEGGAGAYSDGKLTTLVKEKNNIGRQVLETFVEFGAPEDILIDSHPHIGTDLLRDIVKNIRLAIIELGGDVHFSTKFAGIEQAGGRVSGAICESAGERFTIPSNAIFLATGHAARDTFEMLRKSGIRLSPKPSAIGFRIEHPQALINDVQYGQYSSLLSERYPAIYKLVSHGEGKGEAAAVNIRSVYTFCMCPGGYVVNSSFERGGLVTNGMSFSLRDGKNANSAVLIGVSPADYAPFADSPDDPLSGVRFQRAIERKAYEATGGTGALPFEKLGSFAESLKNRPGLEKAVQKITEARPAEINAYFSGFSGQAFGSTRESGLAEIFPEYVPEAILAGLAGFDRIIPGFAHPEAVLTAPETLSSSPVRIDRDPVSAQSVSLSGLYPIGEGAGYAGGITSSAIDGIKAANRLIQ